MSNRGSVKSTQSGLRNSFSVLGNLDDHVDVSAGKKKEKSNSPASVGNEAVKPVLAKKEENRQVPKVNSIAGNGQQKKKEAEKQIKKSIDAPQKLQASSANTNNQSNAGPLMKMLIFAVLMLIMPIGAYYWSVHQAGLDLGEIKSALIAVLIVNVLLFAYILMAFLEESKQNKIKKN